jgi:hypothetical protein
LTAEISFRQEYLQCPICNLGEINSKIIDSENDNQTNETYYYSCGHQRKILEFRENIRINAFLSKIHTESEERVGKKPQFEIEQKYQTNDIDNPNQKVWQILYITRNSSVFTIIFQIVMYESGLIKHIHCKSCNTEWDYHQKFGYNDLFNFNIESKTNIECLYCHAKIVH